MSSVLLERLLLLLAFLYAVTILAASLRAHNALAYWPHGVLLGVCCVVVPQMLRPWLPCRSRKRRR